MTTQSRILADAWKRIWLSPREVIAELSITYPHYLYAPLAAVYGITLNLNRVIRHGVSPDEGVSRLEILGSNLLAGVIFGLSTLYVMSYLLAWVGRLLGGSLSTERARTVLAWASAPYVPSMIAALLLLFLGPRELLYRSNTTVMDAVAGSPWVLGVIVYISIRGICAIWACFIGVSGLSEVSGLSVARTIAVYVIVGVMMVGIFIAALAALSFLRGIL